MKKHLRNERVPDPYNPGQTTKQKNLTGKLVGPSGVYRDRGVFIDAYGNAKCDCPKSFFEGSLKVFVRGTVGLGFIGGQGSVEQDLLSTEEIGGPEIKFTAAVGVTGATIEAGLAGHAKFRGPLPWGQ